MIGSIMDETTTDEIARRSAAARRQSDRRKRAAALSEITPDTQEARLIRSVLAQVAASKCQDDCPPPKPRRSAWLSLTFFLFANLRKDKIQ